jgi:hypothetical protein
MALPETDAQVSIADAGRYFAEASAYIDRFTRPADLVAGNLAPGCAPMSASAVVLA